MQLCLSVMSVETAAAKTLRAAVKIQQDEREGALGEMARFYITRKRRVPRPSSILDAIVAASAESSLMMYLSGAVMNIA